MAHLMIITYLQSEKTLHVDVKERAKMIEYILYYPMCEEWWA